MSEAYSNITTDALRQLCQENRHLLIVDLRDAGKYAQRHIRGAASFPFQPTFWARVWKRRSLRRLLGPDPTRPLAFY